MILNSDNVKLIRQNAGRLAECITSKDDLTELATAGTYEQVIQALEGLFVETNMFFDDQLFDYLNENTWKNFKSTILMYSLNIINKRIYYSKTTSYENPREYQGASVEM